MWAAWFVSELEPEARVVLLEAERCGAGPSGRNGGFVNAMWFSLPALRRRFGDAAALRLTRAAQDAVEGIGRWCEEQRVDAWYRAGGYLQVSTAPAHDGSWRAVADACAELGVAGRLPAAVRSRGAGPLRLADLPRRGLLSRRPPRSSRHGWRSGFARASQQRGVTIFEGSRGPAARRRAGQGVEAQHRSRAACARRAAVLATGPALAGHRPLRRRLTVTSSHMVITEPVPDVLAELGWTGGECITDSRAHDPLLPHHARRAHRLRLGRRPGGAGRPSRTAAPSWTAAWSPRWSAISSASSRRSQGRRVEHAWGGPIDVSPTHLPVVGSIDRGRVHYAFGYTGNGVGPSRIAGRILASLALDRRDEATRLPIVEPPPVRVPPEPLRYAGGTIVRAALLRRERLEEEGRRPGPLTRAIAGLPERIGIHIGR